MKLVVGLGNPGKDYASTRHNTGFLAVDAFAKREGALFKARREFHGEIAEVVFAEKKILLLKPDTFMNRSGEAVRAAVTFWHLLPADVLVIYDDADLPFGSVRSRAEGSAGGHNGMASVIETLGTSAIPRIRMGIGRPPHEDMPLEDWVLGRWSKEEEAGLTDMLAQTLQTLENVLKETP
ncbi:aminoacyl-tRNA hydrolase [Candidatus Uhrbacteria bacterium]|nr:aminoacyl-tRNA hydrolase [Candidatus Uhrbacteria bacterium]